MTETPPPSSKSPDELEEALFDLASESLSKPVKQAPKSPADETPAEPAEEAPEEALEEAAEPVADEPPVEPAEEALEEAAEPIADEPPAEPAEEPREEAPEEAAEPVADETAAQPAAEAAAPEESKGKKRGRKKSRKQKADVTDDPDAITMPLMEHLRELRTRLLRASLALLIATLISFAFARYVFQFLIAPMGDTMPQALKPTESLGNYMKVALICGLTLSMPFIVYQIGRFLAPGLTKSERRWLIVLVPGATISFAAGVAFAYFIMLPSAIPFLQGFLADIVAQQWALGEYLSFVISLMLWIGVAFELPLFTFFLAKLGVIDAQMLSRNRKYAIVLIAIAAAIITPTADPVNMALVMGPLIILYELGILLAKLA